MTSNGLNLLPKGQRSYFLAGTHGETPLTLQRQNIPSLSITDNCFDCAAIPADSVPCLLAQSSTRGATNISLRTGLCIPGRTEVLVVCQLLKSCKDLLGMVTPIHDRFDLPVSLFPVYSFSQADGRHIPVRHMNSSNIDIELPAGLKMSEFCPLVDSLTANDNNESLSTTSISIACSTTSINDIKADLGNALSPTLSIPDHHAVFDILLQYSDVFDKNLGHTTVITHKIDTGDAAPVRQYPRRLPCLPRRDRQTSLLDASTRGNKT